MSENKVRSDADWELLFSADGIPTIRSLWDNLPLWACVAFAARCSRRVQPFIRYYWPDIPKTYMQSFEECLRMCELYPNNIDRTVLDALLNRIIEAYNEADSLRGKINAESVSRCHAAIDTVLLTGYALKAAIMGSTWTTADNASDAATAACHAVDANYRIVADIREDFKSLASETEASDWTDESLDPLLFFTSKQTFTFVDYNALSETIVDVTKAVNAELIAYFTKHPYRLYSIDPRKFEELIAEIFSGFGFQVELTSQTRDGGRDIIAISRRVVRQKYLIECKRYSPNNKVDVGVVRKLNGTVNFENATKGIIATTGFLTGPAEALIQTAVWRLESRDFYGIQEWLIEYQKLRDETVCKSLVL